MRYKLQSEAGSALLVVVVVLLMTTMIGLFMSTNSDDDIALSGNMHNATKAFYSADAGLAIAKAKLWTDYVNSTQTSPPKAAGVIGDRQSYIAYLNSLPLADLGSYKVAQNVSLGENQFVDSIMVTRLDQPGATVLTVSSIGRGDGNASQTVSAVYRVEGEPFKGFDFAILAKNVNCIMCHATIDNVDRVWNTDATKKGTYDRVKVASLESMLIRTTSAESYVAGTVYTRGIVTDKAGNPITNLSPTGMGLGGYAIGSTDGKITEPMSNVSLTTTTGSPLPQFGNLYMNYPTNQADMTDGSLPSDFPPPFPDDNGNKLVDNAEFASVAQGSTGSISGGIIYSVPGNSTYNSGTLPGAGNTTSISQSQTGNVILVGTAANPIVLNGNIAIDGDVIIQGPVKGTGQIIARGNVYVTGDLTYADGTSGGNRTFGVAADGTQNAFSLAAGKNILVGDYLTSSGGNINDKLSVDPGNLSANEKFSFTQSEMTLFNRGEWTKTQAFLPSKTGALVANTTYNSSYVPRYYSMNEGDPVYIYNKNGAGKGTYWDPALKSWMGSEHASSYDLTKLTMLNAGDPALANAKTIALSATSGWITPANLKSLWISDETQRPAGSEFKLDGQMYSSNSIFTLARSAGKTGGKMTVNGSIVAADVGILVATALKINYDQRLKSFLKIKDNSKVAVAQASWIAE